MQKKIPAVYMRGGTSKGLFFHGKDLPEDPVARDRVILAAYGSPNPERPQKPDPNRRQIDGMGGAPTQVAFYPLSARRRIRIMI